VLRGGDNRRETLPLGLGRGYDLGPEEWEESWLGELFSSGRYRYSGLTHDHHKASDYISTCKAKHESR
jgi:hypothetical protein